MGVCVQDTVSQGAYVVVTTGTTSPGRKGTENRADGVFTQR